MVGSEGGEKAREDFREELGLCLALHHIVRKQVLMVCSGAGAVLSTVGKQSKWLTCAVLRKLVV